MLRLKTPSTDTLLLLTLLTLGGCQTAPAPIPVSTVQITSMQDRFDGPGGSEVHDFVNASNACQRETSQTNPYNTVTAIPTCSRVLRCLASKGYVSKPYGKFDAEELKLGMSCIAQ
jgi:hypothetical protein